MIWRLGPCQRSLKTMAALFVALAVPFCAWAQFVGPAPTRADGPAPLPPSLGAPANNLSPSAFQLLLHSGDLIEVTVFNDRDYDVKARIDANGDVYLPLINAVHLDGLGIQQGQQLIAKKLDEAGMVRDPQVTILVSDSAKDLITVNGEVNTPRTIPAFAEMRLLDVIAAAGGLKPSASHAISILRPGVPGPLLVQLGPDLARSVQENVPVYPGDQVLVPRTGVVYVVGAVKKQDAYPIATGTPLTLMQAIALAGGVNFEAEKASTRIIRTIGATRQEIPVNLGKVMFGKKPDPVLQDDDIVFVPTDTMKAALKGGAAGIALGLVYAIPFL